jgi:hypothetical protein
MSGKYREIMRKIEEKKKMLSSCCNAVVTNSVHKDCIKCSECGKLWKINVEVKEFDGEIGLSGGGIKQEGISL